MHPLIVFSDLDGTLLDHETYDYSPALPAIRALAGKGIPLILASSKTALEIAELRTELQLQQWPALVENGAGELPAGDAAISDRSEYQKLRLILHKLPESLTKHYRGFGDMSESEIAGITGLSLESAMLARQRAFTEPGLFLGNQREKDQFLAALSQQGVSFHEGGRFLTLSFGRTKADGLLTIAKRMEARETIALGDAPNDRAMLLEATRAVVVRNEHAPVIGEVPGAVYTDLPGPAGWNEAVLALLESSNY